jgi:glycosyltransferase involved in cell wall biosynthesis
MQAPSSASPSSSRWGSAASGGAQPSISVVVPTRDRPDPLKRCLAALASQTVKDQLEVIVVDDGSVEAEAVAEAVSSCEVARLLRQGAAGPAVARNVGVRAARGTFICLTDDDCEPRIDWVERIVAPLRLEADAVGGTTIGSPSSAVVRASELVARAPALVSSPLDALSFTPSNNLATRSEVLRAVPFDERYTLAAGEDRDWCERLLRSGRVLRHEPSAVLVHHQELDMRSFVRQQVRYGRGAFRVRRLGAEPRALERPRFYAQLVRLGFGEGVAAGGLVCASQLATAAGFIAEWLTTWRQPQH